MAGVTTLWESFEADMKLALALSAVCVTVVALLWFVASERAGRNGVARPSNAVESAPALLAEPAAATLASERSTPARPSLESARVELVRLQIHVVTRGSRAPVSNHRVAAFRSGAPFEWSARPLSTGEALPGEIASTDANGDATLFVEPGQPHVIASVDDLAPRSRVEIAALSAGESRTLELEVREPPDRVVHGLVLEVGTGTPVPGASVSFTENGPEIARSDERGAFVVAGRSRERKQFFVRRPGCLTTRAPLESGHEHPEAPLVVELARLAQLEVRLLDSRGDAVGGEVHVQVVSEAKERSAQRVQNEFWGADASPTSAARFPAVPAGIALEVEAFGEFGATAKRTVHLQAGRTAATLDLVLSGDTINVTLSGFADPRGVDLQLKPVDAMHRANLAEGRVGPALRTDATGTLAIRCVGRGRWTLRCAAPSADLAVADAKLEIVGDGRVHEVALVAVPAARIRGVLLREDGVPWKGRVAARRTDGVQSAVAKADEGGSFEFEPLPPGDYEVSMIGGARTAFATVHAVAGDNFVELRLAPSKYLKLQLLNTSGATVRGRARVVSEVEFVSASYESDEAGVVILLCPASGRPVRVSAHSADGELVGEREFVPRDASELDRFVERFELSPAPDGEETDGDERDR